MTMILTLNQLIDFAFIGSRSHIKNRASDEKDQEKGKKEKEVRFDADGLLLCLRPFIRPEDSISISIHGSCHLVLLTPSPHISISRCGIAGSAVAPPPQA